MPPFPRQPAARAARRALAGAIALSLAACGDPVAPPLQRARGSAAADTLWASVATGADHTCALTVGGRAFCWGSNASGQLGTSAALGTCAQPVSPGMPPWVVPCAATPAPVAGGLRFAQLVATWSGTCGRGANGAVACWGGGSAGPPRQVRGAPALRVIARGQDENVCGLDRQGRAWCWSLPRATGGSVFTDAARGGEARLVPGGRRFAALGAECGTAGDGGLYCWNSTVDTTLFDRGPVALDTCRWVVGRDARVETAPCSPAPVRLRTAVGMRAPAPLERSCALSGAGVPYCWGWAADMYGARGAGARPLPAPEPLAELTGFLCGRTAAGAAYCRGRDGGGYFGNGVLDVGGAMDRWTRVANGWAFEAFAASGTHACGLTAGRALVCWGSDASGQLGSGRRPPAEPCWRLDASIPPPVACVTRPRQVASVVGP